MTKSVYIVYLNNYSVVVEDAFEFYTKLAERDHGNYRRDGCSDDEYFEECETIVMNDESYSSEWLDFNSESEVVSFLKDQIEMYPERSAEINEAIESMRLTKHSHGGARQGAGRKPEEERERVVVLLSKTERKHLRHLGGSAWVRNQIKKALKASN